MSENTVQTPKVVPTINLNPIVLEKPIPSVIRHHFSGVWFGRIVGEGMLPSTIKFEGRRVWSWEGGRLECSQLANQGVRAADRLGDWTEVDIAVGDGSGLVERLPTSNELVEVCRGLPQTKVG